MVVVVADVVVVFAMVAGMVVGVRESENESRREKE